MSTHHAAIDDAAWHSPWRRHRVSEKVLLSLGLVFTALLTPAWPGSLLVGVVAVFLMLGPAQIRPRLLAWVAAAPVGFLLIGTIPVAVQWGAAPTGWSVGIGHLHLTTAGLRVAGELWGHGLSGTLAILLLATTTPMVDVLTWTRRLHIPDALLDIASLIYRLVFLLLSTTLAIREAQRARLGETASLRRRWSTVAATLGSILIGTWQRATRMQAGLEGRGYEESLHTLAIHRPRNWVFVSGSLGGLAVIWAVCGALA